MKARALFAFLSFVAFAVPAAASAPKAQQTNNGVGPLVRVLLAQAPANFAALRLAKDDYDTDFARYKARPIGKHCGSCKIYDQYARGTYKENWYVQDDWSVPKGWDAAKIEAHVLAALRPVLSGFALHRTAGKYTKYATLEWRNAQNEWVNVRTYDGGYMLRVGRDLSKPVHVLHAPTQAQLKQLTGAASNLVRLGAPAASTNFDDLRTGSPVKDDLGDDDYAVNVAFGPMIRKCDVSHVANSFGYKDFQPKWVLSCSTVALAATADSLKQTIRDSVEAALPEGFTVTTDSSALLLDDYRWDASDVSVDISSYEENGSTHFTIAVFHYLPKENADPGN